VPVVDDRFVSPSERRFIMEPHREEPQQAPEPGAEQKPKRFRIVKLEERIAPSKGGKGSNYACATRLCTQTCDAICFGTACCGEQTNPAY
jgi:hypothetical protein